MKLLLDEHYADDIAAQLRAAGHDAVTVCERALKGTDDESLLVLAVSEGRALLTNNARDFLPLVGRWAASGDDHCGVLLTSDSSMPRCEEHHRALRRGPQRPHDGQSGRAGLAEPGALAALTDGPPARRERVRIE